MHAALGLAGAIVLLEALMLNYDKVPFTCTYVPSENMKALAPIYVIAFLVGASLFARMQNDALQGTSAITSADHARRRVRDPPRDVRSSARVFRMSSSTKRLPPFSASAWTRECRS